MSEKLNESKLNEAVGDLSSLTTSEEFSIDTSLNEEDMEEIEIDKKENCKVLFPPEDSKENVISEEMANAKETAIKEKRYKRLMHLLNNSKMYSVILKDRIQQDEATARKKELNGNVPNTKETSQSKKKGQAQYNLNDVLSQENIEQNTLVKRENDSGEETEDEDYFKKTRVTDLGFIVSYKQPLLVEGATMRGYQLKGLDWMKNLFKNGVNGILADEMGLGKTIQVISFICHMIEKNIKGPFLIVAPFSTLSNWMSEFQKFAPKVPTFLYCGSDRKKLLSEMLQKSKVGHEWVHKVIITSFQIPLRDRKILSGINWYYLIIDEGHRIKNHNSLLSRTLREYNTIGRLLLTGTPLQNNLSELWSLLSFLLPEVFNSLDVFESWFDIKELESNGARFMQEKFNLDVVTILQEILVPFVLRREKKDVDLQLPLKKEILIYCPMTPLQKELYQATLDRSIELLKPKKNSSDDDEPLPKRRCFMNSLYGQMTTVQPKRKKENSTPDKAEEYETNISLLNPQVQLRKIVNHPYLIQYPLVEGTEQLRIDEDLVKQSGKLLVLDAMLAKLKAKGHKVLVFSYFKILLDILEDHANLRGYKYCRLDGNLKLEDRDQEIHNFVTNPDIFVFYISIRAGGLGINLTAADTVIFYDVDWNPQANLQSQDRCHRIGQTRPVVVYRLCAKGTIDEQIIERGNAKRRLEKMILQKGKFTRDSKKPKRLNLMDLQELAKIMASTDHDTVINSNGFVLTDEELEVLLDRSDLTDDKLSQDEAGNKKFKILKCEKI